jgi:hypothetical protein
VPAGVPCPAIMVGGSSALALSASVAVIYVAMVPAGAGP